MIKRQDMNVKAEGIKITNFKNIGNADVSFRVKKKKSDDRLSDIIGVYGQNGSGKTNLVQALQLVNTAMRGERIRTNDIVSHGFQDCSLEITFKVGYLEDNFLVKYLIKLDTSDKLTYEKVSFKDLNAKKKVETTLMEVFFDINKSIAPKKTYDQLVGNSNERALLLKVDEMYAKKDNRSFIFDPNNLEEFRSKTTKWNSYLDRQEKLIMSILTFYACFNFIVVTNELLAEKDINFFVRTQDVSSTITLSDKYYNDDELKLLNKGLKKANFIMNAIVPGFEVVVTELDKNLFGTRCTFSAKKDGIISPLDAESRGIIKLFSISNLLSAVLNEDSRFIVIDELDAGIFEYLFGDILSNLNSQGYGQLLFTAHNLRPLEVLGNNHILFSTSNRNDRFVKMTNIKPNHNLRDVYYKTIFYKDDGDTYYNGLSANDFSLMLMEDDE